MTLFAWDRAVAESTARQVTTAGKELKQSLAELVTQVDAAAANGQWSGMEQRAFKEIFGNWYKAADGIFGICDGAAELVTRSNSTVEKFQEDIMSAL
ncbi:MAG: WXG100 family type VII secretion target [Gordonia amarae]